MADKPGFDVWRSVTQLHGTVPGLAACSVSGSVRASARELARQRHNRFVQSLRIPRIRHPLSAHLIWRFVAQGRA